MTICPLCFNKKSFSIINAGKSRSYTECNSCKLIFTETSFLPTSASEKKRYLTHKNGIQYKGYVNFLMQAIEPALPFLKVDMQGLDYGCGHTPTLSLILEKMGFKCNNYDPFFFPGLPDDKYDFIFSTECFEHFFFPAKEIQHIKNLLKPGGLLIVMTEPWTSTDKFANWYYTNDPTHVSFYHKQSFKFISEKFKFEQVESNNERVFMLLKELSVQAV